jgi:hypothetical protein
MKQCKEYFFEIASITIYKDINASLLNKVVDKVGITKILN